MSDVFDGGDLFPPDDPRNPFYGLYGFDEHSIIPPDPYERQEKEVFAALDIDDFGGLLAYENDVDVTEMRGNRFENIREAILYLSDSGLLAFGKVVLFANGEIGIAIGQSP